IQWRAFMWRRSPAIHLLFGELALALSVTRFQLIKVNAHPALLPCDAKKEILQRKIVKHDDAGMLLHRPINSAVVTVIVPDVIERRIVIRQLLERGRIALIIDDRKSNRDFRIGWLKTI